MKKTILFVFLIAILGSGCYKEKGIPVADFSYKEDTDAKIPDTVTFANRSENAVSYEWAFGDGSGSDGENPVHIYKDTGAYDVLLTAYSKGNSVWATKTRTLHIK